jgi:hypothetical protein
MQNRPTSWQPPPPPCRRAWEASGAIALLSLLVGCASAQSSDSATAAQATAVPPEPGSTPDAAAWRLRQIERARAFEAAGQWPRAQLLWQALLLLAPTDRVAAAEVARLARQIDEAAHEHERRGEDALRRGDVDGAEHHFAHLLALQPGQVRALQALRQIEFQRLRRQPAPGSMAPAPPRMGP